MRFPLHTSFRSLGLALLTAFSVSAMAVVCATAAEETAPLTPPLQRAMQRLESEDTLVAWVFLRHKENGDRPVPRDVVSPRALRRLLKVRPPEHAVDRRDLPLDLASVQAVARRVQHLRQRSKWFNAVSVEATAAQLRSLRALPCVRQIDLVASSRRRPDFSEQTDPTTSKATATNAPVPSAPRRFDYGSSLNQLQMIRVTDLHDMGLDGQDVFIAHFDNGYRLLTHEAFARLRVHATWDFVANEENPDPAPCPPGQQCSSHGVETLSILAGFKEGRLIGPAYDATYVLARTENDAIESVQEEDLWVAAMEWADSIGVDIISSSLGYRVFDNPADDHTPEDMDGNTTLITRAADLAAERGIVVVNGVGNDGLLDLANTIYAPADGDSVIAVGAVNAMGTRSAISSYGPTADGRTKPDVLAEGIGTFMAQSTTSIAYGAGSGTSAATPLVAGAAALLLQAYPEATPMQIRDALRLTASRAANVDRYEGWGIIDALEAFLYLRDLGPEPPPFGGRTARIVPNPYPFTPTSPIRIELSVPAAVSLRLFDVRGRLVRQLLDETLPAAEHLVRWDGLDAQGRRVASGTYFLRLRAAALVEPRETQETTGKLVLLH